MKQVVPLEEAVDLPLAPVKIDVTAPAIFNMLCVAIIYLSGK